MEKLFKLSKYGANVKTEISAGITTFFAMSYIIFVNPSILALSGMDSGGVFVATCISAAIGTFIMAFLANLPYAQAPGMGLNAFFAYTVCLGMGFAWQEALAMVFICGIIGIILTATKVRRTLITAIPAPLQNAIGGAIGLFIAYIGLKNAGIINFADTAQGLTSGAQAIPQVAALNDAGVQLALIGIAMTAILILIKARGAILIGIILTTLIGIPMGVTHISGLKPFDMSHVGGIKEVSFAFFGSPGLGSLFSDPSRVFTAVTAIFAFVLTDIFDTIGAFISMGRQSGMLTNADEQALKTGKGFKTRFERGLFGDLVATTVGALLGTSNVTTYIESAVGVGVGGRTGLTSLTTGVLLLLCIPFASIVGVVPVQATAPALILVGLMMMGAFTRINWSDFGEALPAFFTIVIMAFGYSISNGIAAGFIFYCMVKLCKREVKDIHPILAGSTILFVINFILTATR